MPIRFYGTRGTYSCFSNFSRHGIHLDGAFWPTTEHYFQAQKFHGTEYEDAVRRAATPKLAARMGRDRALPLRPDWEAIKDDVMRRAVRQKFTEHADLRAVLLATGDEAIVEDSPRDAYWGCGKDGTGKNMLGTILMEIRVELRTSDPLAG